MSDQESYSDALKSARAKVLPDAQPTSYVVQGNLVALAPEDQELVRLAKEARDDSDNPILSLRAANLIADLFSKRAQELGARAHRPEPAHSWDEIGWAIGEGPDEAERRFGGG